MTLLAEESITQPTKIEALITQIKRSKNSERRILMNELKRELRQINQKGRMAIMRTLQQSFVKERVNQIGVHLDGRRQGANSIPMGHGGMRGRGQK